MRVLFPRNVVLLLIAIALGVATIVTPGETLQTRDIEPLLPEFQSHLVDGVRVEQSDQVRVRVRRAPDATDWTIDELFGADALRANLDSLLSRVGAMTNLDLVGRGEDAAQEFGLDEGVVLILTAGESEQARLRMADAGGQSVFVQPLPGDAVYRIARMPVPPVEPLRWFDNRSIVPLEDIQLVGIRAEGEAMGEPVAFARPPGVLDGRFLDPTGKGISRQHVDQVLQILRTLFPRDVLGAVEEGVTELPDRILRIEVTPTIGTSFQVDFARGVPDATAETMSVRGEGWSALRVGNRFIVAVDGPTVDGLVRALRMAADGAK